VRCRKDSRERKQTFIIGNLRADFRASIWKGGNIKIEGGTPAGLFPMEGE